MLMDLFLFLTASLCKSRIFVYHVSKFAVCQIVHVTIGKSNAVGVCTRAITFPYKLKPRCSTYCYVFVCYLPYSIHAVPYNRPILCVSLSVKNTPVVFAIMIPTGLDSAVGTSHSTKPSVATPMTVVQV